MLIKRLEIRNFRSIKKATLDCENITVLVGRNGAGKSTFLHALSVFYDTNASFTNEDFFNRNIDEDIEIRVTYGGLRDDEKKEFKSFIKDGCLMVTKRVTQNDGRFIPRYFGAAMQLAKFAAIRQITGKNEKKTAWNELVESGEFEELTERVTRADDIEAFMVEFEKAHLELLDPVEREEQFFGPKNVGGGKLDKFTKYVLVPAVREASDEVSGRKSAIYQILDMIVLRQVNARKDITEFKTRFDREVKELYCSDNLTELPCLGESISKTLERFAPGSQLNLTWEEINPPEIPLPNARATLVEDNFEGEITKKGHGLQRALVVTLLQHLAMTNPIKTQEEDEESIDSESTPVLGPDLILAIEEPELYLHPSRCRYLSNLLQQLGEGMESGLAEKNQVLLATHSPYFVSLQYFDNIRMVHKQKEDADPILNTIVHSYSWSRAAGRMAEICDADPAGFTRESFRARAIPVMNSIVNEGFFSNVVVVVEGPSDVGVLWKLQEIMEKDWEKAGVAVIAAGGRHNIDRPVVVFKGLCIPTYFIFDGDSNLAECRNAIDIKNKNRRYLRLAGVDVVDFPETQVHDCWAVFKVNLEHEIKNAVGEDVFNDIIRRVASEYGYDRPKDVCKNMEGSARIIEVIYEEDHTLPVLENSVNKITALCFD